MIRYDIPGTSTSAPRFYNYLPAQPPSSSSDSDNEEESDVTNSYDAGATSGRDNSITESGNLYDSSRF